MNKNDGGPAFPGEQGHIPDGTWNQTWESGMSLRDWFAGQAVKSWIIALVARRDEPGYSDNGVLDSATMLAYATADAMLAERDQEAPDA